MKSEDMSICTTHLHQTTKTPRWHVIIDGKECLKRWKNMRDKFVRIRKVNSSKSGDPGGKKVPALCVSFRASTPHRKQRNGLKLRHKNEVNIPNMLIVLCFALERVFGKDN